MIDNFYSFLLNNFSDVLGSYIFQNNTFPQPAIAILPEKNFGYEFPPTRTEVSGLEFKVITKNIKTKALLARGLATKEIKEFYIQQWTGDIDLSQVGTRLNELLTDNDFNVMTSVLVPVSEGDQIKPYYYVIAEERNYTVKCF